MTGDRTRGQVAYEGMVALALTDDGPMGTIVGWGSLEPWQRKRWEASAQAARADLIAECDRLRELVARLERITTTWTRGMYSAWIDCRRGDPAAAAQCLSEGLDGFGGGQWNGTETGAEWRERTKAEEGL